jgi:hypothetical protein
MAKFDGEAFGNQVVEVVQRYFADRVDPLIKRLEELEQRVASLPEPPATYELEVERVREIAEDVVKSATDFASTIAEQVAEAIPDISEMVSNAVAEIPRPVDGKSVTIEDVRPLLQEMVDAIEIPQPVIPQAGKDGRDGLDVKDMFRAEGGRLIAVMSDGTTRDLGVFVGKDGEPGKDGFDLKAFTAELLEDGRTIKLSFSQEGKSFETSLSVPAMIYRDYYVEGREYQKGDTVTFGGNLWHCNEDGNSDKPGQTKSWRLCAKKGRDGRDLTQREVKTPHSVPTGGA